MQRTIFYSWQSDLPNSTNRSFIQNALEKVSAKIVADDTINVEPVIDRDTQGMSGAPDISSAIFSKISSADIFIADVSIINSQQEGRPTPNPNVLIELGYALKSLGDKRIVLLFNSVYGEITDLPFDLRTRRAINYNCNEKEKDRSKKKDELKKDLEKAIVGILEDIIHNNNSDNQIKSIEAIEDQKPNRTKVLRNDLKEILEKIIENEPKKHRDGGNVEDLKNAINKTTDIVLKFSKIVESVTLMKDKYSALEIYQWFGNIIEKYNLPQGFSGKSSNADQDYFKFMGHELFTVFIAFLQREKQWAIISVLLDETIEVNYIPGKRGPAHVNWYCISSFLHLLADESRKTNRISVHADILKNRYTNSKLSELISFSDFLDSDFLLYLVSEVTKNEDRTENWYPRSIVYMKNTPMFIKRGEKKHIASKIARVFKFENTDKLRDKLLEINPKIDNLVSIGFWSCPIEESEIKKIGTKL